jgi:hypothetical protein
MLIEAADQPPVADAVRRLHPAHLPFLFPEVFLRDNPGFDCLVGNPPWEEVMVEEPKFWLRVEPGLLGLKPAALKKRIAELHAERPDLLPVLQQEIDQAADTRALLLAGPYPGLGTGDVDYYRVFAWRNWQLLRDGGHLGMVFPRSLLNAAGNATWREHVLDEAHLDVVTLLNNNSWVFPIHPQYSFALIHVRRSVDSEPAVELAGPFASEAEFLAGKDQPGRIPVSLLKAAAAGAALPQLPSPESTDVFTQLRRAPRLDDRAEDWDFRPVAEFHATNDRKAFDAGESEGRWPVYGGTAFNIWTPDTGEYYAWASPHKVTAALQAKRKRQAGNSRTAFYGLPGNVINHPATLPCYSPRIAFRDVTNATNRRTVISALVPSEVVLTNKAPYLLRRAGTARTEAFLLGVLSSIPLDWYARRYVELNLNLHILNGFPIPRPRPGDPITDRVIDIAGRLAAPDDRFAEWAADVGVPVAGVPDQTAFDDLVAELDALVALLYGLSPTQVEHVFATFHRGWDYRPRLDAVLAHYRRWGTAT